ncbi:uncharacterized protein LOC143254202 isoform X2 [Tachypleus tridentatus]
MLNVSIPVEDISQEDPSAVLYINVKKQLNCLVQSSTTIQLRFIKDTSGYLLNPPRVIELRFCLVKTKDLPLYQRRRTYSESYRLRAPSFLLRNIP